MSDFGAVMERIIRDALLAETREIEAACETAVLTGFAGVVVIRNDEGRVIRAEPSSRVPYGWILEASESQWAAHLQGGTS